MATNKFTQFLDSATNDLSATRTVTRERLRNAALLILCFFGVLITAAAGLLFVFWEYL